MPNNRKRLNAPTTVAPSGGDSVILVCIALVVAAIVVGLHVQIGLSLGLAAVAGMSLFIGMVGFQAWRRGEAERTALADELHRLEAELAPGAQALGRGRAPLGTVADWPVRVPAAGVPPQRGFNDQQLADRDPVEPLGGHPVARDDEANVQPKTPNFEAYRGAPAVPLGESFSDYWQGASGSEPGPATEPAPVRDDPAAGVETTAIREDDVELLQRRIKDMLYQVTAAEQARELSPSPQPPQAGIPAPSADAALTASIGALQSAAQTMRQRPVAPPIGEVRDAPLEEAVDPHLASVREAIAAGRVDVFLEPILALGDQATQHYEVSIKLRDGAARDLGAGEGDVLAGRGLLPLFDAVRIERSAIVAERLQSRGKTGAVFSRASGESLIEPEFTRNMQLDFVARPATARQLILTFSQADIRSFRAAEQRAVSALSALGFRFAISGLTDLDMNFAAMAQVGFGFVKIDAAVMTDGLPYPGGDIPANDVCRFLADQGFGLIVEGIDSEETLARVFGFGVLMGQGTLFGGRRPVKTDVASRGGQAAA
jgi:cyclic-di-GMP phosphodiesterase TipF (flagellum assembly factor)